MTLPEWLDKEAWDGFDEMRQSMNKKAWTTRAQDMAIKRLEGFYNQGLDPNGILDQSVFMGWKGLFPVREETNEQINGFTRKPLSKRDAARAALSDESTKGRTFEGDFRQINKLRLIK